MTRVRCSVSATAVRLRAVSRSTTLATYLVGFLALAWAVAFATLSVTRFQAGGAHAEDLGFTDQVIWNFLRGQWFRMSIYNGAFWNTEIDVMRLARPDSLLAFHVEPLLLVFVPLYAAGGGVIGLLVAQSLAVASGAVLAARIALARIGSPVAALAVAVAYLLSPFGQAAVLADAHTVTFAAPLILLMAERLAVARAPRQALVAGALACCAREDVGVVVALLGAGFALDPPRRRTGLGLVGIGLLSTALGVLVLRAYSGGGLPLADRYAGALADGATSLLSALGRVEPREYLETIALSGGWLVPLGPLAFVAALPTLVLNVLSSSPWMAAGKAHYSALLLPVLTLSAIAGLARLARQRPALTLASVALIATSVLGELRDGVGPVAAAWTTVRPSQHAQAAARLVATLPSTAAVSASSSLVPLLSHRAAVFVFPALNSADDVLLDLTSSPAPTSAGDVYLRIRGLLATGGWEVTYAQDGLLLLARVDGAAPTDVSDVSAAFRATPDIDTTATDATPLATYVDGRVALLNAVLEPSPDARLEADGPRGLLRTTWRLNGPMPPGSRLGVDVLTVGGGRQRIWDVASLWWNPPETWPIGTPIVVDIPDVPLNTFQSWQPVFETPTS